MLRWRALFLAPLVLIGLPLLAAALLMLRSIEADQSAREAQRAEAAQARLETAGVRLERAVVAQAERALHRIEAAVAQPESPWAALRALTTDGTALFAAVYQAERRLFPSEDSGAVLSSEARMLVLLAGPLEAARRQAAAHGSAWHWVAIPGGMALLNCRRDEEAGADICALIDGGELWPGLDRQLQALNRETPRRAFTLADPEGHRTSAGVAGTAPPSQRLLEGALTGWRLQMMPAAGAVEGERAAWPPYLAAGLPLAGFWMLLAWHVYQRQQVQVTLSRARVALAGQLSHDLRTPLANLRLYLDLIRRRAGDAGAITDYTAVLDQEIERLGRITDAAVALAKGDQAPPRLDLADPDELVRGVIDSLAPQLAVAGCPVTFDAGGGGPCRMDSLALERIAGNLLDNARKYAAGTPIHVETRATPEGLILRVRDHGPGLPGADPALAGAGLGLAAVRHLAAASGGEVRLEDARPGLRAAVLLGVSRGAGRCAS
jgi:signal transduction histidine kinase